MKDKLYHLYLNILRGISSAYLLVTFLLLLFVDKAIDYTKKNSLSIPNIVIIIGSLILLLIITWVCKKPLHKKLTLNIYVQFMLMCIFILFISIIISYYIYFVVGWDVHVLIDSAQKLANGSQINLGYFSIYPNNLFLVVILSGVLKLGSVIIPSNPYFLVIVVTNVLINVSAYITLATIYQITRKEKICYYMFGLMIPIMLLSPWMTVPYSDAWGMIFPISITFIYVNKSIPCYLKCFGICLLAMIGYFIKPTVAIVLIAIICVDLIRIICHKFKFKHIFLCLCCSVVAIGLSFGLKSLMIKDIQPLLDKQKEMPLTHFMMMGLNPITKGSYNRDDYNYSMSFSTKEKRQEANKEMILQRLKDYGLIGYGKLLLSKNLSVYNDGSFSWELEGGFHYPSSQSNEWTSDVLAQYYYADGDYYQLFLLVNQTVWILVLGLAIISALYIGKYHREVTVVFLAILGLSLFLLLFECRARYLFLYLPLYIVLAGIGVERIIQFVGSNRNHRSMTC